MIQDLTPTESLFGEGNVISYNVMRKLAVPLVVIMISISAHAQVKIIAHRGAAHDAPENTRTAEKLAWKTGADCVETDIRLTKDHRIICSHDSTAKRTSGRDLAIPDTDARTLRKLDVGSFMNPRYRKERMPFLHELIKGTPRGKELVVDIKNGPEILPFLRGLVSIYPRKRIIFICFDLEMIAETKKAFPDRDCYWLCDDKKLLEEGLARLPEAGLQGADLSWDIIDRGVMDRAAGLGLEIYAWTVDDPAEAARLVGLGVKGITTNRPDLLRERLAAHLP